MDYDEDYEKDENNNIPFPIFIKKNHELNSPV